MAKTGDGRQVAASFSTQTSPGALKIVLFSTDERMETRQTWDLEKRTQALAPSNAERQPLGSSLPGARWPRAVYHAPRYHVHCECDVWRHTCDCIHVQ